VSKILVIRGGAIGDFILTLPALAALRQQFPNAALEVLGYPHIAQLAVAGGLADAVRSIEARPLAGFFARGGILEPELQEYFASFVIIISYLYDPDGVFETNVRRSCKGQFIAGPHRPDESKDKHATSVFVEPLKRLAIFDPEVVPRLTVSERRVPSSPQSNCIAIHPGSGSEKKNWALERWIELARQLLNSSAARLLIVGGEAESAKIQRFKNALPQQRVEVAFNLPLPTLAGRIASCSLFIGHDSGITHLAAAAGVPVVALWAETSPDIWRPLGDRVTVLRSSSGLQGLDVPSVLEAVTDTMKL
jgi:heptosyltransferase III